MGAVPGGDLVDRSGDGLGFGPDPSQVAALAAVANLLEGRGGDTLLLTGAAGSGKSTIIAGMGRMVRARQARMLLLAPTGRAARLAGLRAAWPATTVHQAIYQHAHSRLGQDGLPRVRFAVRGDLGLTAQDLVVVDEAGLLNNQPRGDPRHALLWYGSGRLLNDLLQAIGPARLALVGDPAQLGFGADADALDAGALTRQRGRHCIQVELRGRHRQAATADLRFLDALRRRALGGAAPQGLTAPQGVRIVDPDALPRLAATALRSARRATVITWTNRCAAAVNRHIRLLVGGGPAYGPLRPGDVLLADRHALGGICTGDLLRIEDIRSAARRATVPVPRVGPVTLTWSAAKLRRVDDGQQLWVPVLEESLNRETPELPRRLLAALAIDFRMRYPQLRWGTPGCSEILQEDPWWNALQARFGWALTCHKAQGGEWDEVFITGRLPLHPEPDLKWIYTALSRARRQTTVPAACAGSWRTFGMERPDVVARTA